MEVYNVNLAYGRAAVTGNSTSKRFVVSFRSLRRIQFHQNSFRICSSFNAGRSSSYCFAIYCLFNNVRHVSDVDNDKSWTANWTSCCS